MRIEKRVVSNRLPSIVAKLGKGARALVQKTVTDLEAQEKQTIVALGAVDTGELYESVHGEMTGETEGQVDVGAEHGVFVNGGTRFMPARPFVQPSVDVIRPQFIEGAMKLVEG